MEISVVVPVYGCRDALYELYNRTTKCLKMITDSYEIILVNDCCPQNSWEVIEQICKKDRHVIGIELSRNFGQMKAILAGLEKASGDWAIVMDCDLQDRPEEILNLYKKALEGYDVVFARRKDRQDNKTKVFLANIFYKVYEYATDCKYDAAVCNFSIINRKVVDSYCKMREFHRGYVMYIQWLGFRQAYIDVEHNQRYSGKSSYSIKKRINMAVELLTSQSDKVLRLFVKLGFLMSFLAFVIILGLIIYKQVADVSIGWTSLIATNVLIGGIIISVLGVIGIYVGNTFMQTKERPLYIAKRIIDNKELNNEKSV